MRRAAVVALLVVLPSVLSAASAPPVEEKKFDWMDPSTWNATAQSAFVVCFTSPSPSFSSQVVKLCFAFSPILALLAVFYFGWETEEEEKLKRMKKADFTFDSPE